MTSEAFGLTEARRAASWPATPPPAAPRLPGQVVPAPQRPPQPPGAAEPIREARTRPSEPAARRAALSFAPAQKP